jgi:hypothetical protein
MLSSLASTGPVPNQLWPTCVDCEQDRPLFRGSEQPETSPATGRLYTMIWITSIAGLQRPMMRLAGPGWMASARVSHLSSSTRPIAFTPVPARRAR